MMKSTETTETVGQSPPNCFISKMGKGIWNLIQETASGGCHHSTPQTEKDIFQQWIGFLSGSFAANDTKVTPTKTGLKCYATF